MLDINITYTEFLFTVVAGLLIGFILKKIFNKELTEEKNISIWETIIFILSIYVIVEVFISFTFTERILPESAKIILLIDNFICGIFIYDFFNGLYNSKNKFTFFEFHWIDLAGSIPLVGPLRSFRIFKVFRLLRAVRSARYILSIAYKYKKSTDILNYTVFAVFLIIIISSISIWVLEAGNLTFMQSFWWSTYNAFGIGMENIMLITSEGLAFGFILGLSGLLLVAVITATFVDLIIKDKEINDKLDVKMSILLEMKDELKIKKEKLADMEKNMLARDKKLSIMDNKIDDLVKLLKDKQGN